MQHHSCPVCRFADGCRVLSAPVYNLWPPIMNIGDAVQNATHGHHGAHTKRDSQRATHCKSGLTDAMQHRETTAGTLKTISTSSPPPRSTPPHPTHTRAHAPSRGVLLPSDMLGFRFSSRTDASTSSGSQYGSSGNMHYPPRGRKNHGQNSRPAPYDKNKFLQANFRFLVSDAIDMSKYRTDADLMLKWDDIVQVCGGRKGGYRNVYECVGGVAPLSFLPIPTQPKHIWVAFGHKVIKPQHTTRWKCSPLPISSVLFPSTRLPSAPKSPPVVTFSPFMQPCSTFYTMVAPSSLKQHHARCVSNL